MALEAHIKQRGGFVSIWGGRTRTRKKQGNFSRTPLVRIWHSRSGLVSIRARSLCLNQRFIPELGEPGHMPSIIHERASEKINKAVSPAFPRAPEAPSSYALARRRGRRIPRQLSSTHALFTLGIPRASALPLSFAASSSSSLPPSLWERRGGRPSFIQRAKNRTKAASERCKIKGKKKNPKRGQGRARKKRKKKKRQVLFSEKKTFPFLLRLFSPGSILPRICRFFIVAMICPQRARQQPPSILFLFLFFGLLFLLPPCTWLSREADGPECW